VSYWDYFFVLIFKNILNMRDLQILLLNLSKLFVFPCLNSLIHTKHVKTCNQITTKTSNSGVMLWILSNDKRKQKIICKLNITREITGTILVLSKKSDATQKIISIAIFSMILCLYEIVGEVSGNELVKAHLWDEFMTFWSLMDIKESKADTKFSKHSKPAPKCPQHSILLLKIALKISKENFRWPDIKNIIFFCICWRNGNKCGSLNFD